MPKKRRKLTLAQTKKMAPAVKEFNSVARFFIRLLGKKVAEKEKKIQRITVLISKVAIPKNIHTISIKTIDMNDTQVKKQGKYSFNQKMDWEEDFRNKKRGLIL
jgi:hypothetical protein